MHAKTIDFVFLPLYFRFMSEQKHGTNSQPKKQLPRTLMKNSIVWMSEAEGFLVGSSTRDEFFFGGGEEVKRKTKQNKQNNVKTQEACRVELGFGNS